MAPVARRLSRVRGILEPLQTANSLEGQVEELRAVLAQHADLPVTLIGYSWGAWLSLITAARYPSLVRKLILVASGPFEEKYAVGIMATRLSRLNEKEVRRLHVLMQLLKSSNVTEGNAAFSEFGALMSKTDSFAPLPSEEAETDADPKVQAGIFESVWRDAEKLRQSGELLNLARQMQCPVLAIHGDYDPHPAEGVEKPLAGIIKDFRFILLPNCGHKPWIERDAQGRFYGIFDEELK